MFSRDHGKETLLRWGKSAYKVFSHTAHTPSPDSASPCMKKLGGADTYGPLAVINHVGNDRNFAIYDLRIYALDASGLTDHTYDWRPLMEDFNANCSYRFDEQGLTLAYQGQTLEMPREEFLEETYRKILQEGLDLRITRLPRKTAATLILCWVLKPLSGIIRPTISSPATRSGRFASTATGLTPSPEASISMS